MLKNSLFWEISSPEVGYNSYIFGTIHLFRNSQMELLNKIEVLISEVEKVYTETALDSNPDSIFYKIPKSEDLESLLGAKKYERARSILLKSLDFDIDNHRTSIPITIVQHIALQAMGVVHHPPLDALIYQVSMRLNKDYGGIETVEEQMNILQRIPLDYQCKALLKLSRNIRGFRKRVSHMIDMYEEERIIPLYQSSKKEMGKLRRLLLYERNVILAQRIKEFHYAQKSLFTFGAGHLAGDMGVLALLKRSGLKVKAIRP